MSAQGDGASPDYEVRSSQQHQDKGRDSAKAQDVGRRYAFACRGCKRRKAKCDGAQPTCSRCDRLGETCSYSSGGSQADIIQDLRAQLKEAHDLVRAYAPSQQTPLRQTPANARSFSLASERGASVQSGSSAADEHDEEKDETGGVADLVHHMSMDDAGVFQHYGSSSLLYQKPPQVLVSSKIASRSSAYDNSFASQPNWQSLAHSTLSCSTSPQNADRTWQLLQTFFCWINPEYSIVTESAFYRDLALSGPYYSRFLLCCVCAHAARYSDAEFSLTDSPGALGSILPYQSEPARSALDCGSSFLLEAKQLLMTEMEKPTSIPTIQGLMILGQRELECGNMSLSWLYVGMAWRMLRDLGLHLASPQLAVFGGVGLPAADQEIRLRLFWAAFSFDKCFSICLGRSPTFNAYQRLRPRSISDTSEDAALWSPLSINGVTLPLFADYRPQKAWTVSVAKELASLSIIASEILMTLYVKRSQLDTSIDFLQQSESRLKTVRRAWPAAIQIDTQNLPEICPPPHIVSLNLLYCGILILLYRPFLEDHETEWTASTLQFLKEAKQIASQMAIEIDALLGLHRRSLGGWHLSYMMLYCCYAAACIDVLDFLSNDHEKAPSAAQRLGRNLQILERNAQRSPSLRTTVSILKTKLTSRPSGLKRERPASGTDLHNLAERSSTSYDASVTDSGAHSSLGFEEDRSQAWSTEYSPTSQWTSSAMNDIFAHISNDDIRIFNDNSGTATPNRLQGDVFGQGSIMPMGALWDFDSFQDMPS